MVRRNRGGLSSCIKEAAMKLYEMEIPGILTWKFKTIDEAVSRTLPVMVRSIRFASIFHLEEDGRQNIVLQLEADEGSCPFCRGAESLIRIWSLLERYDALKFCRECYRSFREYPSRIGGPDGRGSDASHG